MQELLFLAKGGAYQAILGGIGILLVRFMLVALFLYLCGQVLSNIPYVQKFATQPYGRLVIMILILITAIFLVLYMPKLRLLHEMALIRKGRSLVWFDIIFSSLALVRMSYLWPNILDWFRGQTQ